MGAGTGIRCPPDPLVHAAYGGQPVGVPPDQRATQSERAYPEFRFVFLSCLAYREE